MNADARFKELGYTKKENEKLDYIEYVKKEKDGDMTISIITKPVLSVDVRKYPKNDPLHSKAEAIYEDELEALYLKVKEIRNNE